MGHKGFANAEPRTPTIPNEGCTTAVSRVMRVGNSVKDVRLFFQALEGLSIIPNVHKCIKL
jgi:hypothetical protein